MDSKMDSVCHEHELSEATCLARDGRGRWCRFPFLLTGPRLPPGVLSLGKTGWKFIFNVAYWPIELRGNPWLAAIFPSANAVLK
jgi:hypothetical protein